MASLVFVEPEDSMPYSYKATPGPYPEPDIYTLTPSSLALILMLYFHVV
jgi:hypothetical protein